MADDTLMDLIDAYAEARHVGGCHTYNAKTAEARAKVVASLAASAGSEPVAYVDRADAVNLARNLLDEPREVVVTRRGIQTLCKAVLSMDAVLSAHPSPPEGMAGWKPIETAPKDCLVDILNAGRRYAGCHYDRICDEYRHITACGVLIRLKNATHWMPAPPLPASEAKGA